MNAPSPLAMRPVKPSIARRLLLLPLFALLPWAWPLHAAPPPLDAGEQAFVAQATADDDMQIALANLALAKSKNPQVRQFAHRLVQDHTALDLQFSQFTAEKDSRGRSHGLPVQDIDEMKSHLQALDARAFDHAFVGMMVDEHRKIMPAYERAGKNAADARLRQIARRAVPVLQSHLAAATALLKRLG